MIESYKHAKCAFVTLTYNEENCPNELIPKDLQDYIKRLRRNLGVFYGLPTTYPLRYYGAGEYGTETDRPHYHLALFGCGPEDTHEIDKAWPLGFTYIGDLTKDSAHYIAGYVTKKMTNPNNPHHEYLLSGRHPEFARMSLRPGIGATAVGDIADTLTTPAGCDALARVGDVPHALMLEKKSIPLGKYIRGKLREKLNFPSKQTPKESLDAWKTQMQKLHSDHKSSSRSSSKYLSKNEAFKQYLIDQNAQKVLQLETRSKIFSPRKKL